MISYKCGWHIFSIWCRSYNADHWCCRPYHIVLVPVYFSAFNYQSICSKFRFFCKWSAFRNSTYESSISNRYIQYVYGKYISDFRSFNIKRSCCRIGVMPINFSSNVFFTFYLTVKTVFNNEFYNFTVFCSCYRFHILGKRVN